MAPTKYNGFHTGLHETVEKLSIGTVDRKKNKRTMSENDAGVRLLNPHIQDMDQDVLYHLNLGTGTHDLQQMFGDVKFVAMGGTPQRMHSFAEFMIREMGHQLPTGTCLQDISAKSYRYAMYKVGPVLSISHGMGIPSASILLHEIIKLLYHAKVKDPIIFRIGTCGGIGLPPGTVVVTEEALDGLCRPVLDTAILGRVVSRPAILDKALAQSVADCSDPEDNYKTVLGKTISTDDFYEGQGRLDGAICEYTEEDKMNFLRQVTEKGVVNMEMEASVFAALTHLAGIKSAVVCVTLLDRLNGDQISTPKSELTAWQERPQQIVSRYILRHLSLAERQGPTMGRMVRTNSALFQGSQSTFEDTIEEH